MKHRLAMASAVLATAAGLLFATVHTDYDKKADFGKYHTYSWIGVKAGDQLWQNRITSAVDNALQSKGWQKVQSGGDASVSAFGRTTEQDTLQTFYDGFPGWGWRAGWWGGVGMSQTEVIPQKVGNLTVDVFDGQSKQLIFRGVSSDTISGKADKNEKKLDEAVTDMFKKFPPKGGASE